MTTHNRLYDGDTFEHKGYTFKVEFPHDSDMREPWKESSGHGNVTGWERRDKLPGERVLVTEDRAYGAKRFYDFAGAVKTARKDGWGCKHSTGETVDGKFVFTSGHATKGELALCAAECDYDYLRRWCNDDWTYINVHVTLLDDDGDETDTDEWLGGVEDSDNGDYRGECAREMADEIVSRLEVAQPDAVLSEN